MTPCLRISPILGVEPDADNRSFPFVRFRHREANRCKEKQRAGQLKLLNPRLGASSRITAHSIPEAQSLCRTQLMIRGSSCVALLGSSIENGIVGSEEPWRPRCVPLNVQYINSLRPPQ